MYNGYDFMFDTPYGLVTLPITPPSLKVNVGSNNKVVTLINEGDINVLKSPKLVEIEFEARFPMRNYPYSKQVQSFDSYWNIFKRLKEEKKPFTFIVNRMNAKGTLQTWGTDFMVALEDVTWVEDADEGDDVLIKFNLKQYKEYGVTIVNLPQEAPRSTSTAQTPRDSSKKTAVSTDYVVKSGDTLWSIAKSLYGDGNKWSVIYNANKTAIENDANKHGKESSSDGHWIFEGLTLIIPSLDSVNTQITQKTSTPKETKYNITINVSGESQYIGSVTLAYNLDGKPKREVFTTTTSKTVKVDGGANVSVTMIPKNAHSFHVTASKEWSKTDATARIYTISSVKNNGSISINWVK